MGGILQVDTIQNNNATTLITQTNATTLTFGVSGQNIVIPSGVTFNTASATVTLPSTINATTINVTTVVLAAGAVGTPSLTTSGDTNTGIFFPAADTIAFTEGGAEAMRIDSSGRVGIGTTSPGSVVDAVGIASSAIRLTNSGTAITDSANLVAVSNDITSFISAYKNNGTGIVGTTSNHPFVFVTNNTERMRINSDGNLALVQNIGLGGATPTTSGTGITFPATQSASTNANTLDDYEEGTWTAGFAGSATTATGKYTKIGNKVYVNVYGENLNVTSAVNANITGLPFTVASGNASYSTGSLAYNTYSINGGGNGYFVVTNTRFDLINENATTAPNSVIGNPKVIMLSGFYTVD